MLVSSAWASHLCPKCHSPVCAGDWGEGPDGGWGASSVGRHTPALWSAVSISPALSLPVLQHPRVLAHGGTRGSQPLSLGLVLKHFLAVAIYSVPALLLWVGSSQLIPARGPTAHLWHSGNSFSPPTSSGRDTLAFWGSQSLSSELLFWETWPWAGKS